MMDCVDWGRVAEEDAHVLLGPFDASLVAMSAAAEVPVCTTTSRAVRRIQSEQVNDWLNSGKQERARLGYSFELTVGIGHRVRWTVKENKIGTDVYMLERCGPTPWKPAGTITVDEMEKRCRRFIAGEEAEKVFG